MQKTYRIHIGGKIFENSDTRALARCAVQARRVAHIPICRHCRASIEQRELAGYGYCFRCIEEGVRLLIGRARGSSAH